MRKSIRSVPSLVSLVLVFLGAPPPLSGADQPNIILILADDLGYEGLGCYGSVSYQTPHLDQLAAGGIRFTHCYSQPICTPSRVQLMTGRYNQRNYHGFGYLDPRETTFAHLLKTTGYATGIAGKWQLNGMEEAGKPGAPKPKVAWPGSGDPQRPFAFGFDEFLLWQVNQSTAEGERYANPLLKKNGTKLPGNEDAYGPDVFFDFVSDFIDRNRQRPFFVYYPMALVHEPFVPTPLDAIWADRSRRYSEANDYLRSMIGYMDRIVGRLVLKLEQEGLREKTLIIFTGDNGMLARITSEMSDGRRLVGAKGMMTDGGTHVPLICSWPGRIAPGRVTDALVDFSDFLPTLAEAAGATLPATISLDGRSFLPLLLHAKDYRPREWIFSHYWGNRGRTRAGAQEYVRDQRWKLYDDGRFYDVPSDPLEQAPIVAADARAREARRRLEQAFAEVRAR